MVALMHMVGHATCVLEMPLYRVMNGGQDDIVVSYVAPTVVWTVCQHISELEHVSRGLGAAAGSTWSTLGVQPATTHPGPGS